MFRRLAILTILAPILTMIAVVGESAASYGYVSENCRKNNALTYWSYEGYATATNNAVQDWAATSTPLSFTTSSNPEMHIALGGYGSSGYDGITYLTCSGGYQTYASQSYYNTYYTVNYSTEGREQVMVHEIGHALGLGHAGAYACSGQPIMYYSSDRYFRCAHHRPQADDVNGINAIY